ncbi:enoyl-CoA hydratase/isomerase family protein [Vulgatibacter incomptus]|uniref:Enoyl-CoA hydratase n=1 Tax=Vulgatibacter incomptus TaxID=1391653 RepID=A0A0K1P973_9BACT|nr:enoyl-CoA hydratase/isomerase family protein [Vulgatibacter incomptus]AKU90070.1 Enoyl-CoA hydratase [Vulgatibacter incomptus]
MSNRDWTQPSEDALVTYRAEGGVAVITLQDPPANAYSYAMFRQLDDAILRARFDPEVHVLVLTGAGEKMFCAGANIEMLKSVDPYFKYNFCLHANETLNRLEQTSKLVIAALNGHCVGGGLEIAMAADLRIAKAGGGKIGLPEVALGVLPGTGGTQRLSRLVGKSKAIEWMIEGLSFTFEQARDEGLVNKLIEATDAASFLAGVIDYARRFVPPARASKAVGGIKRAVQSGLEMSFESGLALERELQQQLFQSEDAKEGFQAFLEKRPPAFRGR